MSFSHVDEFGNPLANIRNELAGSFSNGPGNRYVVWFQGCGHGCVGCYNPKSWAAEIVELVEPATLAARILDSGCDGVTFTGGEPMSQPAAFFETLLGLQTREGILDSRLPNGILLFTGHTMSEVAADYHCIEALSLVDVAIMGRYERDKRSVQGLRGSTNQIIWWNSLPGRGRSIIKEESITTGQNFETHAIGDGIVITGFPDLEGIKLIRGLKRR